MKTVTRRQILTAIRKENLKSGAWVEMDIDYNPSKEKNCAVCAVGGVLRQAGLTNKQIDVFGDRLLSNGPVTPDGVIHNYDAYNGYDGVVSNAVESFLNKKQYLRALSIKFEDQASKTGTGKKTREVLAKFVKKHFPLVVNLSTR